MRRSAARARNQPLRRAFVIAAALIFSAPISPALAQAPVSQLSMSKTEIVHFVPSAPANDTREGFCWTHSIAASARHDAFRCTVDDEIHDPCFIVPPNHDRLVCGADPALKKDGFLLKLTKPLPKPPSREHKVEPWVFRLADNSICEAMTGTLSPVNGEAARWSCAIYIRDQVRPAGLVTKLTPGKIWMAEKFPEGARGQTRIEPVKVPVKIIWE